MSKRFEEEMLSKAWQPVCFCHWVKAAKAETQEAVIHAEAFPCSHHADALLQVDTPCSCRHPCSCSLPPHSEIVQELDIIRIVCEPGKICLPFLNVNGQITITR